MARSQLAINCPAPLLQRLRAEAQRQQTTSTALVLAWLEAGLDGRLEAPRTASSSDLEQRLAAVEARLDAIAAPRLEPPYRPAPAPPQSPVQAPAITRLGEDSDAITTAELADRLGVKRHALNERLRRAGGVDLGFEVDGWRCVGKAKPARGGPAQWQWTPAG